LGCEENKKRRRFLYAPQIRQSDDDNACFSPVKLLSGILVRTLIKPGEQAPAPCTLPADAVVPEKRSIFPNTSLEIPIPSLTSVLGFVAGWGCVAAIIYSVYLIAKV